MNRLLLLLMIQMLCSENLSIPMYQRNKIDLTKGFLKKHQLDDSGENFPVSPVRNIFKNSFGFQSEWDCY